MTERILILGNGIAGLSAAKSALENRPDAKITMVSEEPSLSYTRPLLSKTFFKTLREEDIRIEEREWYEERGIEQILGIRAEALSPDQRTVRLSDGRVLCYDSCVYALGASPSIPPIRGAEKKGVAVVRTLADFSYIRRTLVLAERAVVIGGGVIGLEMAWEMSQMGCLVTVLEAAPRLMSRQLDEESAAVFMEILEKRGISVHTGVRIEEIAGQSRAEGVRLEDGRWFPADLILLSCGVRANVELAKQAGLPCRRGLVVDCFLRAGADGIYGAGDCIEIQSPAQNPGQSPSQNPSQIPSQDPDQTPATVLNPGLWNYARRSGEIAGYQASGQTPERKFEAPREGLIFHGAGTALFSIGRVEEGPGIRTQVRQIERKIERQIEKQIERQMNGQMEREGLPRGRFLVNPRAQGAVCYEKRFYDGTGLCGAVLIGDLTAMEQIKQEMGVN